MLKHLGLIGSLLFFVPAVIMSLIGWIGPDLTISEHIASNETTIWVFRIVGVVATVLILINLLKYVKSHFGFSQIFTVITWIICISAISVAIFPHTTGISFVIHNISAYILFVVGQVLSIVITLGLWQRAGRALKIFGCIYFVYAAIVGLLSIFNPELFNANVFCLEMIYLAALFTMISVLSYIKLKSEQKVIR